MDIKEANVLVIKAMVVIVSCRTIEQLINAVKYADLTYRKIANEIGLINQTKFISRIERSIGYAQCKIKHEVKLLHTEG